MSHDQCLNMQTMGLELLSPYYIHSKRKHNLTFQIIIYHMHGGYIFLKTLTV